jgi:hypothetical protein
VPLLNLILCSAAAMLLLTLVMSNIERLSYAWLCFREWLRRRMTVTTDPEWPHLPPPRCAKCGYDLRASPDRCPECGAPLDKVEGTIVKYLMSLRGRQKD